MMINFVSHYLISINYQDMETSKNYLTGSFRDRTSAERAYNRLRERGYTDDEINIIMSDETRSRYFERERDDDRKDTEFGNKAMEGAGTGSAIGGAVGATAGIIAALGTSLVIPGLGLVIAGPIAAGLAGAGAGGITGGIVGALVGAGIPKDRAEKHEKDIREGDIVMGVRPRSDEDADYLERDWREYEGHRNVYR
jgi:hypothetical protein